MAKLDLPGNHRGHEQRGRKWLWPLVNPPGPSPTSLSIARRSWQMYIATPDIYGQGNFQGAYWEGGRMDVHSAWGFMEIRFGSLETSLGQAYISIPGGTADPFVFGTEQWYNVLWENDLSGDQVTASRMKVWPAGQTEPVNWLIDGAHSPFTVSPTGQLLFFDLWQRSNDLGHPDGETVAPMQFWFDNVNVEGVQ